MHSYTQAQPIANNEYGVPKTLYWAKLKETGETCQFGRCKLEVHTGDLLDRSLKVSAVPTGWNTLGLR